MAFDQRDRLLRFVERRDQHRFAGLRRNTDRVGLRARIVGRRGRDRAPQSVIVHAVPRAFELEDLVAARVGARDAQRVERRFGAGADVVDDVGAGNGFDQSLRQRDFRLVQEIEGRALAQLCRDGLGHRRMRVTEQCRPRTQVIVDVFAARDVPQMRAFRVRDHQVQFRRQHEKTEAAAREIAAGGGQQLRLSFDRWHRDHQGLSLKARRATAPEGRQCRTMRSAREVDQGGGLGRPGDDVRAMIRRQREVGAAAQWQAACILVVHHAHRQRIRREPALQRLADQYVVDAVVRQIAVGAGNAAVAGRPLAYRAAAVRGPQTARATGPRPAGARR